MGASSSTSRSSKSKFKVRAVNEAHRAVSKGVIEVTTTELLYQDRKTMQRWPFVNIRCLESKGKNIFHFQLVDPNFPYSSEYTLRTFQCSRASELCELVHKAMESGSIIQDGGYNTAWNLNGM